MSKKAIIEELMVDEWQVEDYAPSYNIAPTQNSLVLVQEKGSKTVRSMKWGLIPAWSKNELYGSKMINARSETVTTKPSFKKEMVAQCFLQVYGLPGLFHQKELLRILY